MSRFNYIVEKIQKATILEEPFAHIDIDDIFTQEDFDEITQSEEISLPVASDDSALLDDLFQKGYKIIHFPGSTSSKEEYLEWRQSRDEGGRYHPTCESFGMTLRLVSPKSDVLIELDSFLRSSEFNEVLAEKFSLPIGACRVDCGIQKYLDGYEISPHPDVRFKALTYMININPHSNSAELDHHTHYMRFRPERRYVHSFWQGNANVQRCWVPWDWCETVKTQRKNNSFVVFSPSDDTMHAVRAKYDHFAGQRTQLYGNHWFSDRPQMTRASWVDLDILGGVERRQNNIASPSVFQKDKSAALSDEDKKLISQKSY